MERGGGRLTARIYRVSGPLVIAEGARGASIYEVAEVGEQGLIGEVIGVEGDEAIIQVYEDTSGLRVGEPVNLTGHPLEAELGPGLIGSIYDGIQRPLPVLEKVAGIFVRRALRAPPIPRDVKWHFVPLAKPGDKVSGGDFLGYVQETGAVRHYIMVPPGVSGALDWIAGEGDYTVEEPIARVGGTELAMLQRWPVRRPRPYLEKLEAEEPLITGQRVVDFLFPLGRGGKAAMPGGFGTGKTVTLQTITKWSLAQITIYVGCGERGNEMADALQSFRRLIDPRTGRPMMERSVFIANTSNMPVAAREASVFLGVTIGEYFRDMGYDVLLVADSTSRWAEAMREISGRLEELPGEEGFPAYLGSRLASFYERSGYVKAMGRPERRGSLSIIGAVSPPGADFSEPVTQATLRLVMALYALDVGLAYRRHYPAVNWLVSYSFYAERIRGWWERLDPDYWRVREDFLRVLQREAELEELVRLVGAEALPAEDKLVLEVARMIREDFLYQSALSPTDAFSPPEKTALMAKVIHTFYVLARQVLAEGVPFDKVMGLIELRERIARMKEVPPQRAKEEIAGLIQEVEEAFKGLMKAR